ncbi:hypothetical protein DFJ74DRAFT_664700 [Hyaloraphidium curvatum]|nr:hypothetical protein DFJ74DRAFT_664700 [Hyaloraphidium curvatum]
MYAAKLGFKESTLRKFLWGDFYLESKRKRILGAKHLKGREGLKPLFVQFVLENVFAVYDAIVMNYNRAKIDKIISALQLKILPRDLSSKDHKGLLQTIFQQWLPLSTSVLLAIVDQLPNPKEAQLYRTARILQNSGARLEDKEAPGPEVRGVAQAMERCEAAADSDSGAPPPVVVYVSKMFHVRDDMVPKPDTRKGAKGAGSELTPQELKERRLEILRKRQLVEKLEGLSLGADAGGAEPSAELPPAVPSVTLAGPHNASVEDAEDDEDIIGDYSAENGDGKHGSKQHLIGFARIFSGTVSVGDRLHLLGPKYDPRFPHLHRTEITVKGLYLLMGRELLGLNSVKAGNIFGIRGLGTRIVKTGTVSSTLACPSLTPKMGSDKPIVRCAIEAKDPRQIKALSRGLKLLSRADPSAEIIQHESGEQVIVASGELHLERLLKDLKEVYARGVDIRVSDPVVPFRETIAPLPATNPIANMNSLGIRRDESSTEGYRADAEPADSAPALAGGRRPATESTPTAPLPQGTVVVSTPNRLARLRIRCLPLPLQVLTYLEEESDTIKGIVDSGDRRAGKKEPAAEGLNGTDVDTEQGKRAAAAQVFLQGLREKFEEAVAEGAAWADKDVWSTVVENIWAFGPRRNGPNILVNNIRGYVRTAWDKSAAAPRRRPMPANVRQLSAHSIPASGSSVADTAEASTIGDTASNAGQTDEASSVDLSARGDDFAHGDEGEEAGDRTKSLSVRDFDGSINTGFQLSMLAGPLCSEAVVGVCIMVEEFKVENLDGEDPAKIAALSGQVISTMQLACKQAFLQWSPRLCLAMYAVDVQATAEVLGKVYAVIAKRKGRVLSEELQEGTPFFNVSCVLPIVESFGFADDLRKRSSGAANPQLIFRGFETLPLDPFWVPNTEEELEDLGEKADRENIARKYMEQVRKRKGLYVEKKIVEHGEKQRTLKSK